MGLMSALMVGYFALWGEIKEETPQYTSMGSFTPAGGQLDFEVRDYAPSVAAETCDEGKKAFRYLAGYIGVMSTPKNSRREKIEMTAPVVEYDNQDGETCMQFILPESQFKGDVSAAPLPTDSHVSLVGRDEMMMAVHTFSGRPSDSEFQQKLQELVQAVEQMGEDFGWSLAQPSHKEVYQYNPPWTMSRLRTNEVAVQLVRKN